MAANIMLEKCNEFRVRIFALVSIEHKTTRELRRRFTIKKCCVLADPAVKLYRLWGGEIEKSDWPLKTAQWQVLM